MKLLVLLIILLITASWLIPKIVKADPYHVKIIVTRHILYDPAGNLQSASRGDFLYRDNVDPQQAAKNLHLADWRYLANPAR